jgi:hypothetical protein
MIWVVRRAVLQWDSILGRYPSGLEDIETCSLLYAVMCGAESFSLETSLALVLCRCRRGNRSCSSSVQYRRESTRGIAPEEDKDYFAVTVICTVSMPHHHGDIPYKIWQRGVKK